jgi:hypothetical protein
MDACKLCPTTFTLLIGLLVLELGVERGPDLGLGEGVVVYLEVQGSLEEARELLTRGTTLLCHHRRGCQGGCGSGARAISRGGHVAPRHPQLRRPRPRRLLQGEGHLPDGLSDPSRGGGGGQGEGGIASLGLPSVRWRLGLREIEREGVRRG